MHIGHFDLSSCVYNFVLFISTKGEMMFVCGCLSVLRAIIMMMIYNADCAGRSWARRLERFDLSGGS
jgi:hypothetical protein